MIHDLSMINNKVMKIFFLKFVKVFFTYLIISTNAVAKESVYFDKGKDLFKKKQYDKSKIQFERDIVFNPKNEKSYLYLAKIFNERENDEEYEFNLNNVLLLNPQNDEATYMLVLLKIKQSDYNHAKELIDQFILICKSFCSKKDEIQEKLSKLTPENAKVNN